MGITSPSFPGGTSGATGVFADLEVDSPTLVVDETNNRVGVGTTTPGAHVDIHDTTTSSANTGGHLRLSANDGAVMGDSHRLGVIEFTGAEDTSGTQTVGARIESLTEAAWTNAENGAALYFYTTDGNASQANVLKLDSNKKATFAGNVVTDGSVQLKEKASALADTATYGQLWVKTAVPNQLYFTTDAGDDIQLTSGTATAFVGDITGVTAGTGLSGGGTTGALTVNLDSNSLTEAAIANGDYIMFNDATDSNAPKREALADLVSLLAGTAASTGLAASSSVLSVSDLHPVGVDGAANQLVTDDGDGTVTSEANLQFDGTGLKIKEAAAASADTAAYGQVWVKNTTPAELWFTDDTGTDIQITAGGTAAPSGVEVHLGEAVGASLVVCGVAIDSGKISVNKAIPTNLNKCRGPFFVTDASGSSGDIVTVLERKIVTGIDTSGKAVGDPVYLHTDGTATFTRPGVTADDAAFNFIMIIGRILKIHGSDGAYVLEPKGLESQPLMGQVAAGGGTSTLVTGFAGYADVPVIAMINEADPVPGDDDQIKSAFVRAADGKLQITIDAGSANYNPYTYMIFF